MQMKEYKYILLDLDGTITDPMIGITRCVEYALNHFGIQVNDLRELCPFIGPPLLDSFRDFYHFTDEQAKEATEKYRERFADTGIYESVSDNFRQNPIILCSDGVSFAWLAT